MANSQLQATIIWKKKALAALLLESFYNPLCHLICCWWKVIPLAPLEYFTQKHSREFSLLKLLLAFQIHMDNDIMLLSFTPWFMSLCPFHSSPKR